MIDTYVMTDIDQRQYQDFVKTVRDELVKSWTEKGLSQEDIDKRLPGQEERLADEAWDLWLRWKCLNDLYFLGAVVLGWENAVDRKTRRRRIDPELHSWLCSHLQKNEDGIILIPRDTLKSSWFKLKIIQDILNNPNIRICLCSLTSTLAEKELADIKNTLSNPILRGIFPDIIPDPGKEFRNWEKSNATELTMIRRPDLGFVPQGDQIMAVGLGKKFTGFHFDALYFDDVIDDSSVTTFEQLQKAREGYAYLQPMLEPDGIMKLIGTFYHYNDLYNTIIKEKHVPDENIIIRGVREGGKIIYSYFTEKYLDKMFKRLGKKIFNCQYNLDPTPVGERIFNNSASAAYEELPREEYSFYISVDPAATTSSYSDETGICVAAVNRAGLVYIVESFGVKKKSNDLADFIINKCVQYRPIRVGIELGLQTHFKYILESKKAEYEKRNHVAVQCNIVGIPISRSKSKEDRVNLTLGAFFRGGKLRIHKDCYELMQQMDMFTGKEGENDNQVDAASMLFYAIETFAFQYWIEPTFQRQTKMRHEMTLQEILAQSKNKILGWNDYFQKVAS